MKPIVIIEATGESCEEVTSVGEVDVLIIDWENVESDIDHALETLNRAKKIRAALPVLDPSTPKIIELIDRLDEIIADMDDEDEEDEEDGDYDDADDEEDDDEILSVDHEAPARAGDEEDRSV